MNKPSVLIISKDGSSTGAGIALYRIHCALNKSGKVNSNFLAWYGKQDLSRNYFVNENYWWNKFYRRVGNFFNSTIKILIGPKNPKFIFSHNFFPNLTIGSNELIEQADYIFLGWIGFNYLSIEQLQIFKNKKIIWRLSDSWPFTGGCHVSFGCEKYQQSCRSCPQLIDPFAQRMAHWHWARKKKAYSTLNVKFLAPSHWMEKRCRMSSLIGNRQTYLVPTGVDLDVFKPYGDKGDLRKEFGIPQNTLVLLLGAAFFSSESKGLGFVLNLFKKIDLKTDNIMLLVFGDNAPNNFEASAPIKFLGRIEAEDQLRRVYNLSDVFLAPYIEDNLPNIVIEAIACGLPVVGFRSGGMPDLVDHLLNGYLVEPGDTEDFERALRWVIANLDIIPFKDNSRQKSLSFSMEKQVKSIENIIFQF